MCCLCVNLEKNTFFQRFWRLFFTVCFCFFQHFKLLHFSSIHFQRLFLHLIFLKLKLKTGQCDPKSTQGLNQVIYSISNIECVFLSWDGNNSLSVVQSSLSHTVMLIPHTRVTRQVLLTIITSLYGLTVRQHRDRMEFTGFLLTLREKQLAFTLIIYCTCYSLTLNVDINQMHL